jgi:hypothetical protein
MIYLCEMNKKQFVRSVYFSLVLVFVLIGIDPNLYAQNAAIIQLKGKLADHQSEEPIPFASVSYALAKRGVITDSAGNFAIPYSPFGIQDTLLLQSVGYTSLQIPLSKLTQESVGVIHLFVQAAKQEAVVKSKYNRSLWFWRKIMSKRDFNNPALKKNYSYELYNKLEVDLINVRKDKLAKNSLVKPLDFVFDYIDTTETHQSFLPIYITETISDYFYQSDPTKSLEEIKYTRTNGIENETLIKELGGTYQNINVYKNVIPVFNREFISPFNTNADTYYKFKLADTAYLNGKRLVHLLIQPKRMNELTFEGDCWVNDTSFAIQKITLRPSTFADINFLQSLSLIQEFKLVNDTVWFLSKDRFVADFTPGGKDKLGIKGRKTTTYRSIKINDTTIDAVFNSTVKNPEIRLMPNSTNNNEAAWQTLRHEPLAKTEQAVYTLLDTLNKNKTFLFYKQSAEFLVKGIKEVGNVTLGPWFNVISSDKWEGLRLRADIATNKGFSKHWNFYGYGAYGFRDQKAKGELGAMYQFKQSPLSYIKAEYHSDLEFGQEYFDQINNDNLFGTLLRRPNIPFKFLQFTQKKIEFFQENNKGFQLTWGLADKQYDPLLNLPSIYNTNIGGGNWMHAVEASVGLRFAYQERYLESNFTRFGFGSLYPVVEMKYTKAIKDALGAPNDYQKLNFSVNDYLPITPFGNIYYSVFAGKTWGKTSYPFLDIMPGNEMSYYNKYAFNLMQRYEFISDEFIGLNIEHKIGKGVLKYLPLLKKTKWRQFWSAKAVVGGLSDANYQMNFIGTHPFNSLKSKPYAEVGTGIENIAKFFRIDFVWRLTHPQLQTATASSFGIFGSFRVSL